MMMVTKFRSFNKTTAKTETCSHFTYSVDFTGNIALWVIILTWLEKDRSGFEDTHPGPDVATGHFPPEQSIQSLSSLSGRESCLRAHRVPVTRSSPAVCRTPQHCLDGWGTLSFSVTRSSSGCTVAEKKAFLWRLEKSLKCLAGLKAFSCSLSCYLSTGSL